MSVKIIIGELLKVIDFTIDGDTRLISKTLINELEKGVEYPKEPLITFINSAQETMIML